MGTPSDLFSLQKIDTSLFELRATLHEIQQALAEPRDLVETRADVETLTQKIAENNASVKDSELQIGSVQAKLNRSTERLYSGKIKNPKELEDLENEVKSLTSRIDDFELELMELMETQETLSSNIGSSRELLAVLEEDWSTNSAALKQRQAEVANQMKGILESRKSQAQKIEAGVMEKYVKLLKSKGGLGIVKLDGSKCEGCKIGMDAGTTRQVNSGQLANCPNCGRYLVK